MDFGFSSLNWLARLASVIAGQMISTIWFVVLFGEPWAADYGTDSKQQHAREIPGYTYGVGLLCTIILVLSIAALQQALSIESVSSAIGLGLFLAVGFCAATGLPGQAFLKHWRVFLLAYVHPTGGVSLMVLTKVR